MNILILFAASHGFQPILRRSLAERVYVNSCIPWSHRHQVTFFPYWTLMQMFIWQGWYILQMYIWQGWYILKMYIRHSEFVNLEFNMFKPNQYIRYTIYTRLAHAYQPINEKEIMSIRRVQSTLLHQIYIYQIHVHYFRFAVSRDFPMWSTSNLIKAEHNTTEQTELRWSIVFITYEKWCCIYLLS